MLRRCGKGAVRQPLVRLAASLGMERYGENPYRSYSSPALEFALTIVRPEIRPGDQRPGAFRNDCPRPIASLLEK